MSNTTCGFQGNSDIYGVGIRIGYYTQALTAWFSNFFVLREANDVRAVKNLFLLALVIAIIIYARNAPNVYAIETFLLMQIGFCLGSISIMDSTRYSSKYIKASKERLALKLILLNVGLTYNLYFWWFGLDEMKSTPCGTYAFYFARANIYGKMRTAMKILAVAGLVWRTLFTTLWDAGKIIRQYRLRPIRELLICAASSEQCTKNDGAMPQTAPVQISGIRRATSLPSNLTSNLLAHSSPYPKTVSKKIENSTTAISMPAKTASNIKICDTSSVESRTTDLPNTQTNSKVQGAMLLNFLDIWKAEKYLEYVLSTHNVIVPEKKSLFKLFGSMTYMQTFNSTPNPRTPAPSFMRSLFAITWSDMNTRHIRDTLSVHSKAAEISISHWPFTVGRILEKKAMGVSPDWRAIAIASDIQLSQMPLVIPRKVCIFKTIQSFLIIVILVIQIELTIVWNYVYEIQNFSSIGQLIPLIIGIGGLIKVCWSKWQLLRKGGKEENNEAEGMYSSEYEEAMEKYLRWKQKQKDLTEATKSLVLVTAISPAPAGTVPL